MIGSTVPNIYHKIWKRETIQVLNISVYNTTTTTNNNNNNIIIIVIIIILLVLYFFHASLLFFIGHDSVLICSKHDTWHTSICLVVPCARTSKPIFMYVRMYLHLHMYVCCIHMIHTHIQMQIGGSCVQISWRVRQFDNLQEIPALRFRCSCLLRTCNFGFRGAAVFCAVSSYNSVQCTPECCDSFNAEYR
jgi:hypothetical protein